MPNARETRITVESTSASPSVLVLNTQYLYRNKFGILKSLILILSLVIFILLLLFKSSIPDKWTYLLCINFCHLYIISLMTACCLFSLTTATLMTKITFDFVFHIMAFVLYLIAGIWICVQDLNNNEVNTKFIAACTLIVSFIHLAHSVLSYKTVI